MLLPQKDSNCMRQESARAAYENAVPTMTVAMTSGGYGIGEPEAVIGSNVGRSPGGAS